MSTFHFTYLVIGGKQHDHGIHAFCFGPDGKLYFNFGNASRGLKTPDGKVIVDKAGNENSGIGWPTKADGSMLGSYSPLTMRFSRRKKTAAITEKIINGANSFKRDITASSPTNN